MQLKSKGKSILHLIFFGAICFMAYPVYAEVTIIAQDEAATENAKLPIEQVPVWSLAAGHSIGNELQAWGGKAGWKVIWQLQKDWIVPAATDFKGDFTIAAADVIKTLAENGVVIHAMFFEGNKTMVISGPGAPE